MKSLFQVYAFCEGIWRTPAWFYGIDLTAHGVDPSQLSFNIQRAVERRAA